MKKILSIGVLIIGLVMLAVGGVFLGLRLNESARLADGEFLVEVGEWTLTNEEGVIWNFAEIGKGSLTTNNHQNDYDFIWAIEDGKLKIETEWLYELENEYSYRLDQDDKTLILDDSIEFIAK